MIGTFRNYLRNICITVVCIVSWHSTVAQPDYSVLYKPSLLSPENLEKVVALEEINVPFSSEKVRTINELIDSLNFNCSNSELYALALHKDKNIRQEFLPVFSFRCKNTDSLYGYLKLVITDTTVITLVDRCLVEEMEYGSYAYQIINRYLTNEQKNTLQEDILKTNTPFYLVQPILERYKTTPENYSFFKSLVTEYNQFEAIYKLLSYQDSSDRKLLIRFVTTNRHECQRLMVQYPHQSFKSYIDSMVTTFSKSKLKDQEYGSLCWLIDSADSLDRKQWFDQIIAQMNDSREYSIAGSIYHSSYYQSSPTPSITLTLIPSLNHIDSANLYDAYYYDPETFDRKISSRFNNSTIAFDLETTIYVFRLYMARPSTEKNNQCLKICEHSFGPELIEAIDAIRSTQKQQIASILEKRYHPLRNEPSYTGYFHTILSAIAFLDDTILNRQLAPELTDLLLEDNPQSNTFVYLQIISSVQDPILFDKLLIHLENTTLSYREMDLIRFFLEQPNKLYHQRLVKLYHQLVEKQTEYSYCLYDFKIYLIQYGLIPS